MNLNINRVKDRLSKVFTLKSDKRIYCHYPYTSIFVLSDGSVLPCCFSDPIGNLNENDIKTIWNSEDAQKMRYYLFQGNMEKAGCSRCGFRGRRDIETYPRSVQFGQAKSIIENIQVQKKEYEQGKGLLLSFPSYAVIQITEACNLRCVMCFQDRSSGNKRLSDEHLNKVFSIQSTFDEIQFTGGEPFVSKRFKNFLEKFDAVLGQKFSCTTNATLLKPFQPLLEKLVRLHLGMSVDGATQKTYESIRVGAKWEETVSNVTWVAEQRNKRRPYWDSTRLAYVIQKSNYEEIPRFVEWAKKLEMPVMFAPVFGDFNDRENIFKHIELIKGMTPPGQIIQEVESMIKGMPEYEKNEISMSLRKSLSGLIP
jgi:radical SAM protein with 4Fe4S-binding SPASM domain